MEKGYVQVYTGDGKGKTTAAIGLAVRALGAGCQVFFGQFMKVAAYSEHRMLADLSPRLTLRAWGQPCFIARREDLPPKLLHEWEKSCVIFEPGHPPADYLALIEQGLAEAAAALSGGAYDLVVLDELNVAMHLGLVAPEGVLSMLSGRHLGTEVVLTGRGCPALIQEAADLVTEMRQVKHYYEQGVEARLGIES